MLNLHPIGQGLIKNFKMQCSKRIVWKVITAFEDNQSMLEINLPKIIPKIVKVWNFDVTYRITGIISQKLDSLTSMRIRQVQKAKTVLPNTAEKKIF